MNVNATVEHLLELYGDGESGDSPTRDQWHRVISRDPNAPFALVNFFKLKAEADYPGSSSQSFASGEEAFARYAAVSVPAMNEAGGEFLAVAPYAGSFLGEDEDWDLIAIGKYPDLKSFLSLYQNPNYIEAFEHRTAAVSKQAVFVMES